MTDNEILKALECCKAGLPEDCIDCPEKRNTNCIEELTRNALDLIKRQRAELEDKQKHLELWVKKFYAKKSDVERLEMEKAQLESDISNALCNLDTIEALYENAKAEAIKEFADKLKEKGCELEETGGFLLETNDIDNLVKEMGCGEQ